MPYLKLNTKVFWSINAMSKHEVRASLKQSAQKKEAKIIQAQNLRSLGYRV